MGGWLLSVAFACIYVDPGALIFIFCFFLNLHIQSRVITELDSCIHSNQLISKSRSFNYKMQIVLFASTDGIDSIVHALFVYFLSMCTLIVNIFCVYVNFWLVDLQWSALLATFAVQSMGKAPWGIIKW